MADRALDDVASERFRLLAEAAPVGMAELDLAGNAIWVNDGFRALSGLADPTPIPAAQIWALFGEEQADCIRQRAADHLGRPDGFDATVTTRDPDGRERHLELGCRPHTDPDGQPLGALVWLADRTDAVDAHRRLAGSEDAFRTLADDLPLAVFLSDEAGELAYVNPRWRTLVGREGGPALAEDEETSAIHPEDRERVRAAMLEAARDRRPYHLQYRVETPADDVRWVSSHGTPLFEPSGEFRGAVGFLEDITPLVEAHDETARLAQIVESTSDFVGITDLQTGQVTYLNRAARDTLGLDSGDGADLDARTLLSDTARASWDRDVLPELMAGRPWSGELEMVTTAGEVMQVWQSFSPHRDPEGRLRWVSSLGRDVTERRRLEELLAHQATHDSLTNLPNRARLLEHLEEALDRMGNQDLVAVLFLDLDRFKVVNDRYGHDAGDVLLAQVAERLTSVLRPTDTVARLGGDEFVVLCEDIDDEQHAVAVARRVSAAIESRPFVIGEAELALTASVGIAISSGSEAHSEVLLRDADAAMYRAKDRGRARLELFDDAMRRRNAERVELVEELADGLEQGELRVHYQPCVDLSSGQIEAVEALARWQHPTRGMLGPSVFIPAAEESGLIVGLGLTVLTTACADANRWASQVGAEAAPRVHVNVSPRQILTPNLPRVVAGVLDHTGLRPELLCLEITESVLLADTDAAIGTLGRLTELGVRLAVDDFGTGYSALSYLRRFPVHALKIDGSFVEGMGPHPDDDAFVGAIIDLGQRLGLEVIAEGVETLEQAERLRQLGCTLAQGFYFARPGPAAELEGLLGTPLRP